MRAIVQRRYGPPEVLRLEQVPRPVPADDQVLVRVRASAVHAGDWHLMRGDPFISRLIYGGLRTPSIPTIGTDIAGEVAAVGAAVTGLQVGEAVFGDLSEAGFGGFADYVCAPATALAPMPAGSSFAEAAVLPVSALTALQALRDAGQLKPGQRVLIHGASGGVGSYAVQIAKAYGAEVTGLCRAQNQAMVLALGADHVSDLGPADLRRQTQRFDLIVDMAAFLPIRSWLPLLTPAGTYVLVGGDFSRLLRALLLGPLFSRLRRRQVVAVMQQPKRADLLVLKELVEAGQLRPWIDGRYPLDKLPDAVRRLEARQVKGKLAIEI